MQNPASNRELMKRAPSTVVVVAVLVAFLAVLGAFVALVLADKQTGGLVDLIERGVVILGALSGAGGLAYSASAARSAAAAQEQTNGSLDPRMRAAVAAELHERLPDAVAVGIARALDGQEPVQTAGAPPAGWTPGDAYGIHPSE